MHNQQQYFQTNNTVSKFTVIALSIVLITGLALVPTLQLGVHAQVQQQPQQQNQVGLTQVIKQIAQQVANANPGTNATQVQQVLVQLAKQTAQTASQEQAIQEIRQISSQVATYPFGTVSQSLAQFAKQVGADGTSVMQIAQQIIQEKSSTGKDVSGSVVTKAVQTATGANSNNINQVIRQAAQTLATAAAVPVEYVEAVIIQIALQVSQAQGKAISGQTIFEIANQIAQNPNGILAQAIIQLVKQYMIDNGKTIQTVQIINNVIKTGGSSSKTIVKVFERGGGGDGKPPPPSPDCTKTPKPPGCPPDPEPPDCTKTPKPPGCPPDPEPPCEDDPTAEGCPPDPEPPCEDDPTAEGCPPDPEPPCEDDPTAEGCEDPEPIPDPDPEPIPDPDPEPIPDPVNGDDDDDGGDDGDGGGDGGGDDGDGGGDGGGDEG
jgi:hypothetical protein